MYLYCGAHQKDHRDISADEVVEIAEEYALGNAQVVTPNGVFHKCILDIIGRSHLRNERARNHGYEPVGAGV